MNLILKIISSLVLVFFMNGCQTTTQVSGCQNSVALGFGVFQVGDLKCTYDSDFQRGTSKAISRAGNDDYKSYINVQQIVHANMFWNLKPIKDYDFKAGFFYIKLKNNCFSAQVKNEQTVTYYSVCKNNYQPFNQSEVRKMIEERFNFATYNSSSQNSSSDSSNSNQANCKKLGFIEGTANFKKCLSNLSK